MTVARAALLLGAGALAGIVGSAGGTASLISYPALLAVGLPPLPANITNAVAFVAAWPGSALGSRPELRGQGRWLRRGAPLPAAGTAACPEQADARERAARPRRARRVRPCRPALGRKLVP